MALISPNRPSASAKFLVTRYVASVKDDLLGQQREQTTDRCGRIEIFVRPSRRYRQNRPISRFSGTNKSLSLQCRRSKEIMPVAVHVAAYVPRHQSACNRHSHPRSQGLPRAMADVRSTSERGHQSHASSRLLGHRSGFRKRGSNGTRSAGLRALKPSSACIRLRSA